MFVVHSDEPVRQKFLQADFRYCTPIIINLVGSITRSDILRVSSHPQGKTKWIRVLISAFHPFPRQPWIETIILIVRFCRTLPSNSLTPILPIHPWNLQETHLQKHRGITLGNTSDVMFPCRIRPFRGPNSLLVSGRVTTLRPRPLHWSSPQCPKIPHSCRTPLHPKHLLSDDSRRWKWWPPKKTRALLRQ